MKRTFKQRYSLLKILSCEWKRHAFPGLTIMCRLKCKPEIYLSDFKAYAQIYIISQCLGDHGEQDHGAGGKSVGSLTTLHTNTPITVLDMEFWNVIRLLYVYAYISLSE